MMDGGEVISPLDLAVAATEHRIKSIREWQDIYSGIYNEAFDEVMQDCRKEMMQKIAEKKTEILDRLRDELQELMQKSGLEIQMYAGAHKLGHVLKFFNDYQPSTSEPTVTERMPQEENFAEDIKCVMDCLIAEGRSPEEEVRMSDGCMFYQGRFYEIGRTVWIASAGSPQEGTIREVTHGYVLVGFKEGGRLRIPKEKLISGEIQIAPKESPEEVL